MKYPFAVKYNGKFYRPNTEIPEKAPKVKSVKAADNAEKAIVSEKETVPKKETDNK